MHYKLQTKNHFTVLMANFSMLIFPCYFCRKIRIWKIILFYRLYICTHEACLRHSFLQPSSSNTKSHSTLQTPLIHLIPHQLERSERPQCKSFAMVCTTLIILFFRFPILLVWFKTKQTEDKIKPRETYFTLSGSHYV